MVLPNGNVYARLALDEMAAANEGRIRDPRTGEVFARTAATRAYVL